MTDTAENVAAPFNPEKAISAADQIRDVLDEEHEPEPLEEQEEPEEIVLTLGELRLMRMCLYQVPFQGAAAMQAGAIMLKLQDVLGPMEEPNRRPSGAAGARVVRNEVPAQPTPAMEAWKRRKR